MKPKRGSLPEIEYKFETKEQEMTPNGLFD